MILEELSYVIFRECFVQVIFIKLTRGGSPSQFIEI